MEFKIKGMKKPIVTATDENGCEIVISHTARDTSGYCVIQIGGSVRGAHRLVWESIHGPIPDGMFVLHKCDVRDCVRPDHLHLGTQEDNMREMYERNQKFCKLNCRQTPIEIEEIRTIPGSNVEKAKKYNTSISTISQIMTGKLYRIHAYVDCKRVLLPESARYHGIPEWYGTFNGRPKKGGTR